MIRGRRVIIGSIGGTAVVALTSKHGGDSVSHQSAVRKTSLFLFFFLNTSPLKRRRAEAKQEVNGCGARVLLTHGGGEDHDPLGRQRGLANKFQSPSPVLPMKQEVQRKEELCLHSGVM